MLNTFLNSKLAIVLVSINTLQCMYACMCNVPMRTYALKNTYPIAFLNNLAVTIVKIDYDFIHVP